MTHKSVGVTERAPHRIHALALTTQNGLGRSVTCQNATEFVLTTPQFATDMELVRHLIHAYVLVLDGVATSVRRVSASIVPRRAQIMVTAMQKTPNVSAMPIMLKRIAPYNCASRNDLTTILCVMGTVPAMVQIHALVSITPTVEISANCPAAMELQPQTLPTFVEALTEHALQWTSVSVRPTLAI